MTGALLPPPGEESYDAYEYDGPDPKEARTALAKRVRLLAWPWKKFITSDFVPLRFRIQVLRLREYIVNMVSIFVREYAHHGDSCSVASETRAAERSASRLVKNMEHEMRVSGASCTEAASYPALPARLTSLVRHFTEDDSVLSVRQRNNGTQLVPYVMDLGSKRVTSNADITLVNARSTDIVDYIIRRINEHVGSRVSYVFTEADLERMFDISFFLNSFLVVERGRVSYIDCSECAAARALQRSHAKSRLVRPNTATATATATAVGSTRGRSGRGVSDDTTMAEFPTSMDLRVRVANAWYAPDARRTLNIVLKAARCALLQRLPCVLTECMSLSAYAAPEAYRSQGAFLHVVLEIQGGARLRLAPSAYMDSAYDNLGMLFQKQSDAAACGKVFSKYASRIVDALRKVAISRARTQAQAQAQTTALAVAVAVHITHFLDSVTVRMPGEAPLAVGSIGLRSVNVPVAALAISNAKTGGFVRSVLRSRARVANLDTFYVPQRRLRPERSSIAGVISRTHAALDEMARVLDI